jgi:NADH dehydrogenase
MHLSGFLAWMAWLLVHIWYLIGFRNRLVVMITWAWSYFTYRRGARLIVGEPPAEASEVLRLQMPPPAHVAVRTDGGRVQEQPRVQA